MKIFNTRNGFRITRLLRGRSNVFLVEGNNKRILIDTSPGNKWTKLKLRLKNLGINKINYLILTHTHYDHAGNASKIKRLFEAKVIVNKQEVLFLQSGEMSIPSGTNLITKFIVNNIAPLLQSKLNYEPCQADIIVDQYLDLNELGINGIIIHTPGHSPGSQSVIIDNEIAIVGDAMFGIFPGSIYPSYAEDVQ